MLKLISRHGRDTQPIPNMRPKLSGGRAMKKKMCRRFGLVTSKCTHHVSWWVGHL